MRSIATRSLCITLAAASAVAADEITVSYDSPTLDRWVYPFNPTPGSRFFSSIFGAFGNEDFDNRDGQMLVGFDTAADVPPGMGAENYQITAATVTVMYDGQSEIVYDNTQDPWTVFINPEDAAYTPDVDEGHPIELFGAGFRNGFDAATFLEDAPHGPLFGFGVRNAFAQGFDQNDSAADVSNTVREEYDPVPWAVGQISGLGTGDTVPGNAVFVFDIDVSNELIQGYLQEALDDGRLRLTLTSLHLVGPQEGSFPTIYTKENPLVLDGLASAATLDLTVEIPASGNPADIDNDGVVGVLDLVAVILAWGECAGECPEDVNGDGAVDVSDLVAVIVAWS